jgi:hypothetical protein
VSPLLSEEPGSGELYATRPASMEEFTWPPTLAVKPLPCSVEVACSTDIPPTSGTVVSTPAIWSPGGVWKSW